MAILCNGQPYFFLLHMKRPDFPITSVSQETFSDVISQVHHELHSSSTEYSRREVLEHLRHLVCASVLSTQVAEAAESEEQSVLLFNGESSYISIPSVYYPGNCPITVDTVITPASLDGEQTIIGNHHSNGFALRIADEHVEFIMHNGKQYLRARSDEPVTKDASVQLTGVFDGYTVRLHVDQKLQQLQSKWSGTHRASKLPLLIGADPDGGGVPQHLFTGAIEQVRISSVARDRSKAWKRNSFGRQDKFDALYLDISNFEKDTIHDRSRWKHLVTAFHVDSAKHSLHDAK